jgi:hypothetical protein
MVQNIEQVIASFPKDRPPLPEAHRRIYENEYKVTRMETGQPWVSKMTSSFNHWMHEKVAEDGKDGDEILEIGSGTLNHVGFEHNTKRYDIVEPFEVLMQGSPRIGDISHFYRDIREIDARYDRIISCAVLEHLTELPFVVAKSALALKEGGRFAAGIPSEGEMGWHLAQKFTTGLAYRLRNGISKEPLMKHEHVNTASEIEAVLKYFFKDVRVERYPAHTKALSVYTSITASQPDLARCRDYVTRYLAQYPDPFEPTASKTDSTLPRINYSDACRNGAAEPRSR